MPSTMKRMASKAKGRIESLNVTIPSLFDSIRIIKVYLPPDYDKNQNKTYPVIYMHDGQNLFFNRDTTFKNGSWRFHLTLDAIYHTYQKSYIVVGLSSSSTDRTSELSYLRLKKQYKPKHHQDKIGEAYFKYFTNDLIDFIQSNYRADSNTRYIGGASMGGIAALLMALKVPHLYQGALCFTPGGLVHYQKDLKTFFDCAIADLSKNNISLPKLYWLVGGVGLEKQIKPFCDWAVPYLLNLGYQENKNLIYTYHPRASHNEKAWARVLPHALTWMFDLT